MSLKYTDPQEIPKIVSELRQTFTESNDLKSLTWRKDQLSLLAYMIEENKDAIAEAFKADLGWNKMDTSFLEIDRALSEIIHMRNKFEGYCKPVSVNSGVAYMMSKPHIKREARGVVLIVAPFNYPLQLLLIPLAGAIAAGNCVVMKPSEFAPNVNTLLTDLIAKYLDNRFYRVVNGGVEQSKLITQQQFDFIFYTGNGNVAKLICHAAAEYLCPVALELGGQCPAIVDETMVDIAAKRAAWAKHQNAGQTCVAINHCLVMANVYDRFLESYTAAVKQFEGDDWKTNFANLITDTHYGRVADMLKKTKGQIVHGNQQDRSTRFLSHTIVKDVSPDDPLMDDEIFGPILPVIKVESLAEAIDITKQRGSPLAIYVFSTKQHVVDQIASSIQSGSVVCGDALTQMAAHDLPFGGVGPSGYGSYHGKRTFDLFTYERSYITMPPSSESILSFRYYPLTDWKIGILNWMLNTKINFSKPSLTKSASRPKSRLLSSIAFTLVLAFLAQTAMQTATPEFVTRLLARLSAK